MNFTTMSPGGTTEWIAAFTSDFTTTAAIQGLPFTFSLDVLRGPGSFGAGQAVELDVEQAGTVFYSGGRGLTYVPSVLTTLTFTSVFDEAQCCRMWASGPAHPDFHGGIPTHFGLAGGNSSSGILTMYYDNYRLEAAFVACAYTLSATTTNHSGGGCGWTATSSASWLRTSSAGTGPGWFYYVAESSTA